MKRLTAVTTLCCVSVLSVVLAPCARADDWNRKTTVTFSGPVEIPGVHLPGWGVLPAGTYVFKILDSMSDRHIVQIFSQDERTVYATILAIPNERLRATDKTVITFMERPAGEPEALRAWFYPGRTSGEEFVYPKSRAIAKAAKTPVLFTPVEIPAEVAEPIKTVDAPVVADLKRVPVMAVQPSGDEVPLAAVVTAPAPAAPVVEATPAAPVVEATPAAPAEKSLPATASPLPAMLAIGLAAFASASVIRAYGRRVR
jgi:hypothetical protein